jgi:hypothetical protein
LKIQKNGHLSIQADQKNEITWTAHPIANQIKHLTCIHVNWLSYLLSAKQIEVNWIN